MERWIAFIMRSMSDAAKSLTSKPARLRASSIAQSVKSAEKGGRASIHPAMTRGKLIKGKKRHVLVDMQGLLLQALITPADVQDRDGGIALLSTLFGMFPFLTKLFADSGYQGPIFHTALASILPNLETEIVRRSDAAKGFVVCPSDGSWRGRSDG